MAKCWPCVTYAAGVHQHCRRCDCCRPLVRPDLYSNSGYGSAEKHLGCLLLSPAFGLFLILTAGLISLLIR